MIAPSSLRLMTLTNEVDCFAARLREEVADARVVQMLAVVVLIGVVGVMSSLLGVMAV